MLSSYVVIVVISIHAP